MQRRVLQELRAASAGGTGARRCALGRSDHARAVAGHSRMWRAGALVGLRHLARGGWRPPKLLAKRLSPHSLSMHGGTELLLALLSPARRAALKDGRPQLLRPAANDVLQPCPVSKRVNSSRADANDATVPALARDRIGLRKPLVAEPWTISFRQAVNLMGWRLTNFQMT